MIKLTNPVSKKILSFCLILCSMSIFINISYAEGVAAGTIIKNTAYASYYIGNHKDSIISLETSHSFTVSETINAVLTALNTQAVVVPTPSDNRILSWQLSNTGNGTEAYQLAIENHILEDDFDPTVQSIWAESNNIPGWQSNDTRLSIPTDTITLAADQSQTIYIHSTIPDALNPNDTGKIKLIATASTANQEKFPIGHYIPNVGDHNTDAVFLIPNGSVTSLSSYVISTVALDINKTIFHVIDRYNSTQIMSGSLVTYRIEVDTTGLSNQSIENLIITDKTPTNMQYITNSIKLNGYPLSDKDDNDQADYNITTIDTVTVSLGNILPPQKNEILITYKVN